MLIIKGRERKSVLVNILMDKTKSICFQYYDKPVIWDSICVDRTEYSLNDFINCIEEELEKINTNKTHYDYMIIYTNEREKDLTELISWLNKYKWKIFCNDILVMCKE